MEPAARQEAQARLLPALEAACAPLVAGGGPLQDGIFACTALGAAACCSAPGCINMRGLHERDLPLSTCSRCGEAKYCSRWVMGRAGLQQRVWVAHAPSRSAWQHTHQLSGGRPRSPPFPVQGVPEAQLEEPQAHLRGTGAREERGRLRMRGWRVACTTGRQGVCMGSSAVLHSQCATTYLVLKTPLVESATLEGPFVQAPSLCKLPFLLSGAWASEQQTLTARYL